MYHAVIVDDEMLFLRYLRDRVDWKRYGVAVSQAFSSARQALDYIGGGAQVDLLLTDIKMPGMNGIDLIRALPESAKMRAFILVLSGYDDFYLVREAFRAGASDYLLKSDVNAPAFSAIMGKALEYLKRRADSQPAEAGDFLTGQIREFVRQNLSRALTLREIAAHFGFSPGYLSQIFSEREEMTLSDYIVGARISRAKELLNQTDRSITEILYSVGFNSPEHFSRTFRRLTGMSPRQYRKEGPERTE